MAQQTMNFQVDGMTCAACQANVQRTVQNLTGVKETNVNLLTGNMFVEVDPDVIDGSSIAACNKIGYVTHSRTKPLLQNRSNKDHELTSATKAWQERIIVSMIAGLVHDVSNDGLHVRSLSPEITGHFE